MTKKPQRFLYFMPTIPLKKYAAAGGHEISRFEPQMVVDPVGVSGREGGRERKKTLPACFYLSLGTYRNLQSEKIA